MVPDLRRENVLWDEQMNIVIDRFRLTKLGPKVMDAWKREVHWQKQEKEKDKFRSEMWSKVNGWLSEIDHNTDH